MKKVTLVFSLLLLVGNILMAQKQTAEEANAAKIIDMTNGVIEMYNNYTGNLKKVREGLEKSIGNVETLSENRQRAAYGFNCSNFVIRDSDVASYEKAAKAAPTFPEKAKIQETVAFAVANNQKLAQRCSALNEYFTKKQYVEDADFSQFQVLFDSLEEMYLQVSGAWRTAVELSSDAGDRSEIFFLKKSPIADFIIPMKEDLARVKKLIDKFYEDEVNNAEIKADIAAIEKAVEKNRSTTGKKVANLEKYSSPGYFTSFYDFMDDFIKNSTTLNDLLNPEIPAGSNHEDKINNNFYFISSNYKSLIGAYNEM